MTDPLCELRRKAAEAIEAVSHYTSVKEALNEILAAYEVSSPSELLEKIRSGELPEHPTYEDYLEAKSLWEDLEDLRKRLREAVESL